MTSTVTFYGETYSAIFSDKVAIPASDLRELFNTHEYWYRATVEQEFSRDVVYQDEASEANNQPPGTVSEIVIYHQARRFFVRVHQYVLPFGEADHWGRPRLGGRSAEPDPKDLIFDDEIWYWAPVLTRVPKGIRRRKWLEEGR